ncbi:MAG: hypothetical protein R3Y29_03720 [bacterium]
MKLIGEYFDTENIDYNKCEVIDGYLYVKLIYDYSGYLVGTYNNYLSVALTIPEIDDYIQIQHDIKKKNGKIPDKYTNCKYLAGKLLDDYILYAYGKELDIYIDNENVLFRFDNLVGVNKAMIKKECLCKYTGYTLRGKPVSIEQFENVFVRLASGKYGEYYEELFKFIPKELRINSCILDPSIRFSNNCKINSDILTCKSEFFIKSNGVVGIDSNTHKYTTILELINGLTMIASQFDFLDMILVITSTPEWSNEKHNYQNVVDLTQVIDGTLVDFGILIKDGFVTFINAKDSSKLFKEYYNKYNYNLSPLVYDYNPFKSRSIYCSEEYIELSISNIINKIK